MLSSPKGKIQYKIGNCGPHDRESVLLDLILSFITYDGCDLKTQGFNIVRLLWQQIEGDRKWQVPLYHP